MVECRRCLREPRVPLGRKTQGTTRLEQPAFERPLRAFDSRPKTASSKRRFKA